MHRDREGDAVGGCSGGKAETFFSDCGRGGGGGLVMSSRFGEFLVEGMLQLAGWAPVYATPAGLPTICQQQVAVSGALPLRPRDLSLLGRLSLDGAGAYPLRAGTPLDARVRSLDCPILRRSLLSVPERLPHSCGSSVVCRTECGSSASRSARLANGRLSPARRGYASGRRHAVWRSAPCCAGQLPANLAPSSAVRCEDAHCRRGASSRYSAVRCAW